ncbi:MAG: flagellar hook-associated protein FlgL [Pseudomonadota bacterium]
MSIRTSTLGTFERALAQMQASQARVNAAQQQIASGTRLDTAAGNPVAASVAVMLDRSEAEFRRFGENADRLRNRLSLQEATLATAGNALERMREIALQANSGVLDDATREALVPEILGLRAVLLSAANAADGEGRFLFGGTQDGSAPFSLAPSGVIYAGDQMQRRVDVGPDLSLADTDPGSELFLRVRTGNGLAVTRADPANAGTAVLQSAGFVDQSEWDGGSYRVEFNAGNYQVLDAASAVVAAGSWSSGQPVVFRGYQLVLAGTPANGDAFAVDPAPAQDVFALADRLVTALRTAETPASAAAARQNRFFAVIEDITQATAHLGDARADTGSRLSVLDQTDDDREGALLHVQKSLSELRDLDFAEAVSRLTQEATLLEAAQQSFVRIQGLSLFNFLR